MKNGLLLSLCFISVCPKVVIASSEHTSRQFFEDDKQCILQENSEYSEERYLQIYKKLCDIANSDKKSAEGKVNIFRKMIERSSFNHKYAAVSVLQRLHSDKVKIFTPIKKTLINQLIHVSGDYIESGKETHEHVYFISYCIAVLPKLDIERSNLYNLMRIQSLSTFTHEIAKAIISLENKEIIDEYNRSIKNTCCQKITEERWEEILEFIQSPNDYSDNNSDIAALIDRWKREVWNKTVKSYDRMTEEARQNLLQKIYRQLGSHDSDKRQDGLISIQILVKEFPLLMENEKKAITRSLKQIEQQKLTKRDALLIKFIRLFLNRDDIASPPRQ